VNNTSKTAKIIKGDITLQRSYKIYNFAITVSLHYLVRVKQNKLEKMAIIAMYYHFPRLSISCFISTIFVEKRIQLLAPNSFCCLKILVEKIERIHLLRAQCITGNSLNLAYREIIKQKI